MNDERKETFIRIPIGIISGLIMEIWGTLVLVLAIFHWFAVLFVGKRNKSLANFGNQYATYVYSVVRYLTFTTNQRPFPFNEFGKSIDKVDLKKGSN